MGVPSGRLAAASGRVPTPSSLALNTQPRLGSFRPIRDVFGQPAGHLSVRPLCRQDLTVPIRSGDQGGPFLLFRPEEDGSVLE